MTSIGASSGTVPSGSDSIIDSNSGVITLLFGWYWQVVEVSEPLSEPESDPESVETSNCWAVYQDSSPTGVSIETLTTFVPEESNSISVVSGSKY